MLEDFNTFLEETEKAIRLKSNTEVLNSKIEEEVVNRGLGSAEELKKDLPRVVSYGNESISLVRADGIGMTSDNQLTRIDFIGKLKNKSNIYGDLAFTPDEVSEISKSYQNLSTGINSVLPMRCTGADCHFAADCVYQKMGKSPAGLGCIIEYDLLAWHTEKLMNQFEVEPDDHTELMLIQEVSEGYVLEMRLNRVLAEPQNSRLFMEVERIGKNETTITEEEHWAFRVKEKIKTRRMKLLESLNATRSSIRQVPEVEEQQTYFSKVSELKNMITKIRNSEVAKIVSEDQQ